MMNVFAKSLFRPQVIALAAASLLGASHAATSTWPTGPIRIVVPYPAGGTSDTVARLIGNRMSEIVKQPVVVENRPGASGNIGASVVAKSAGDGQTLVIGGPNNFASNQFIYKDLNYNIEKDLVGISMLASVSNVMLIPNTLESKTVTDFVKASQAKAGGFNCASTGIATTSHMTMELFKGSSKANLTHIPMKGSAGVAAELIGARVECAFDNLPGNVNFVKTGKFKALAVTGTQRSPSLPDVPTLTEMGYPDVVSMSWFALAGPSTMPPAVTEKISATVQTILAEPEISAKLQSAGYTPQPSSPKETAAYFAQEIKKWKRVIDDAKITLE
jgi:tripartite-type tricarboxylate transporter receptor subunit TctC